MTSLWCFDCGSLRVFEPVPDGPDQDWTCVVCDAAVVVGDLPTSELPPVAAVA
jgi:hypothetical protein